MKIVFNFVSHVNYKCQGIALNAFFCIYNPIVGDLKKTEKILDQYFKQTRNRNSKNQQLKL